MSLNSAFRLLFVPLLFLQGDAAQPRPRMKSEVRLGKSIHLQGHSGIAFGVPFRALCELQENGAVHKVVLHAVNRKVAVACFLRGNRCSGIQWFSHGKVHSLPFPPFLILAAVILKRHSDLPTCALGLGECRVNVQPTADDSDSCVESWLYAELFR